MKSSKLSKIKQTQPNIVVTDSSDENEGRIVITKMKWNEIQDISKGLELLIIEYNMFVSN